MAITMRDSFWDRIYDLAKKDKDIVIVAADFAAPSLDKFRIDFPKQFINVGISEQNAILVATGLALAGKKPIAYAITQFISLRCYEQIRIYPCGMNLPITIVGVGAGACYFESGFTHHCIEQISAMRIFPNLKLINCSDENMAAKVADYSVNTNGPKFIMLDREIVDAESKQVDFDKGYEYCNNGADNVVVTTGIMTNIVGKLSREMRIKFNIINLYTIPVDEEKLLHDLKENKRILTVEENVLCGGMGSYILEILSDNEQYIPVKRIGIKYENGYNGSYQYGGREKIREVYGMGIKRIEEEIKKFF